MKPMKTIHILCAAILLTAYTSLSISAASINGKTVGVHDGDTITVLQGKTQYKIRLVGIDTPELKQAFGTNAKRTLSGKVFGKRVRVQWEEKDRYGRILGNVYVGRRWINNEMLAEGYGWHYKQYSNNRVLAQSEDAAKRAKLGLWRSRNPTPPWEFRKNGAPKTTDRGIAGNQQRSQKQTEVVYVTRTGKKYHGPGCRYLAKSKRQITLQEALSRSYEACKVCRGK